MRALWPSVAWRDELPPNHALTRVRNHLDNPMNSSRAAQIKVPLQEYLDSKGIDLSRLVRDQDDRIRHLASTRPV